MDSLRFDENVTLDDVFNSHQLLIYDQVLTAIHENYQDPSVDDVSVIKITIGNYEYKINLSRQRFEECLRNAISFYESIEAYEKCKTCKDIITDLEHEKKSEL